MQTTLNMKFFVSYVCKLITSLFWTISGKLSTLVRIPAIIPVLDNSPIIFAKSGDLKRIKLDNYKVSNGLFIVRSDYHWAANFGSTFGLSKAILCCSKFVVGIVEIF